MNTNQKLSIKHKIIFSNLNSALFTKKNIKRMVLEKRAETQNYSHSNEKENTKDDSTVPSKNKSLYNIKNVLESKNFDKSHIKSKIPNKDRNKFNLYTEPSLNKNVKILTKNPSFYELSNKIVKIPSLNKIFDKKNIRCLFHKKIANKNKIFSFSKINSENLSKNISENISKINIKDILKTEYIPDKSHINNSFLELNIKDKLNNIKIRTQKLLQFYSNYNITNKHKNKIPISTTNNTQIKYKSNVLNKRNSSIKRNKSSKSESFYK